MNKSGRERLNLILSAFLILGYVVCSYFFMSLATTLASNAAQLIVCTLVYVIFGLLLFYATRVGDGKPVYRFSLFTLLLVCVPAFYVILAYCIPNLPLYSALHSFDPQFVTSAAPFSSVVMILACVALGYGLPYSFISGFETVVENEEVVEGGLKEELEETEAEEVEEKEEVEDTEDTISKVDEIIAEDEEKETEEEKE